MNPTSVTAIRPRSAIAVPIILGVGVLALFTLPNLSESSDDGWSDSSISITIGFSDLHDLMGFTGYGWVYPLAFAGIGIAAIAAIALPRGGLDLPRKPLIAGGALVGLVIPLAILIAGEKLKMFGEAVSGFSWGLWLYSLACVAAGAIAMLVPDPDSPQGDARTSKSKVGTQSSTFAVPSGMTPVPTTPSPFATCRASQATAALLAIGGVGLLTLPVLSFHSAFIRVTLGLSDVLSDLAEDGWWWLCLVALIGFVTALAAVIVLPRDGIDLEKWQVVKSGTFAALAFPSAYLVWRLWSLLEHQSQAETYWRLTIGSFGTGMWLYIVCCAAAIGIARRQSSRHAAALLDTSLPSWLSKKD